MTRSMGDLLSLSQFKLPVKVIVFNNGALGFIELEQKSTGFLDTGTEPARRSCPSKARGRGRASGSFPQPPAPQPSVG
jgi:pyruvate dehydrogenase (quinone)